MRYVIGIDAGGSKTLALLVAESGEVVARRLEGGANPRSVGREQAADNLRHVIQPLLEGREVDAICLGAAGNARPADREFFEATLRAAAGADVVLRVLNDAQIALAAGTRDRPAMVVIAGTGSLVYGERADGSEVRCGGYGAVLGDTPGAYAIGLRALHHAASVLDGVEQTGLLSEAVLESMPVDSVPSLVERIHRWPPEIGAIAALASVVGDTAERDPAAKAIERTACGELRAQVARVAAQTRGDAPLPIIVSGGAFDAVPPLLEAVREGGVSTGPCLVGQPVLEPAHGAALLALEALKAIHRAR